MKLKGIASVYFSPTGNTKKIVTAIAEEIAEKAARAAGEAKADEGSAGGFAGEAKDASGDMIAGEGNPGDSAGDAKGSAGESKIPVRVVDFTLPGARQAAYRFEAGELVVFGTPTYAGRIPNRILPAVQTLFEGNGALAVPVVTFGNRSFDNALIELRIELEQQGFHTIAGGAFVSEHVFSDKLASGRPDVGDLAAIREFAGKVAEKVSALAEGSRDGMALIPAPVQVKGIEPVPAYYRPLQADGAPANFLKAKPKTTEDCDGCGLCADLCPMGSIPPEDPRATVGTCIKCQACVKACPVRARYFDDPAMLSHILMLEQNYARRAENETFL